MDEYKVNNQKEESAVHPYVFARIETEEIMNTTTKTKNMIMTGMFAAVLAVLSQISIPMPSGVPVTLQTFAVALTGFVLGWRLGGMATVIYVLLGAIGVPVFSGFSGGLGVIFGKTGGFIYGFIIMAALCGLGAGKKNKLLTAVLSLAGLFVCHFFGALQFSLLMSMSIRESALLVSVPYLIKDVISVVLAYAVGEVLKRSLRAANVLSYAEKA